MAEKSSSVLETSLSKQSLLTSEADAVPATLPIVGIGASAGGLDALTKLVSALPDDAGMAYILIQHLDPTHKSLMAELLAKHTAMPVLQATENSTISSNHIYVIPSGSYLSANGDRLHLSAPTAPHGARMPVDFLFESMAKEFGERAIAIILSGTGNDGSSGIEAIKNSGGFVIVQDPAESEYDGMPQSAIASGAVDRVLAVAKIPAALAEYVRGVEVAVAPKSPEAMINVLPKIIDLMRRHTPHDFTLYKMGTLQRRIERRMALASIPVTDMARYLSVLEKDAAELNLLATDLLINVTSFFRDPDVFALLAKTIVPEIVRLHTEDRPLRIWITGCSTGEETYSLAMIFVEAMEAAERTIRLSVFASDVDPDAVATARAGRYPGTIAADVSPERLARFFVEQEHGYTVVPELRANIVFNVQDLLTDPPFSNLDMVSCRNLLIYLGPDAQTKVIALFHFALRQGGTLLLGSSETIGQAAGQFETVVKSARIYRRIGKSRPGALLFSASDGNRLPMLSSASQRQNSYRQPALAELCRRLVLESYAPAAVLINRKYECLYSMGPTDRYLRVAPGYPTHDLLAMASPGLRTKLRAAIDKATRKIPHVIAAGGRTKHDGRALPFSIDIRLVQHDGEELLLIGFVDAAASSKMASQGKQPADALQVTDLEQELDAARADLAAAIHDLDTSGEEHRSVNEEALSVNEEYQSANEELLTSKEELQSLNEELTSLNGELQETLERQRTTSNDLQNVLYSTDVATLFLDAELKIRFFTPATKALFNLIPGDVGRPLSDLHALSSDPTLADDARGVLRDSAASDSKAGEREVEVPGGIWFMRHILPYRTDANVIEGVVITFTDITEKKFARKALEVAKFESEQANRAKSRFLAAASHDLRQPLQSLALLTGLLGKAVEGKRAHSLIKRLDQTLVTMSGMLNTMLDINQIEAGVVQAEPVDFVIGDLIESVRRDFVDQAKAQKLELRAVRSTRILHSDPIMIEQMLRNLISNALKYTKQGKILIGCRQHGEVLSVEVWDTGIGIAKSELNAIFDEYHQIDNAARERSLGLGLGLSIVQRLGMLLGHRVSVRSLPGKGSVFSIEVAIPKMTAPSTLVKANKRKRKIVQPTIASTSTPLAGNILIVDDDPDLLDLLDQLLTGEGYKTATAPDAKTAISMIAAKTFQPDAMLIDYNLPGGMNGIELATETQKMLGRVVPVAILTGDISTTTLRKVAAKNFVQLNKPVQLDVLEQVIRQLLTPKPSDSQDGATIYIIDDDSDIRATLRELLEADGRNVKDYGDCESFLASYRPVGEACLLLDAYLPGIGGIDLLQRLKIAGYHLPTIMITGSSAVPMAVEAMKVGAIDFLEKPVGYAELRVSIERALELSRDESKLLDWQTDAAMHIDGLTPRQHQVMDMVLAGHPSKNIAADLNISQRTVENHRASIMKKTGAKSIPALARLALAAAGPLSAD
ncbi:chemotaxis protein CheB [Parasphingorhabdus sp.]|uniref:chemotaxis protein CheB n=1 Tax=Parasphingorhabdus sp. TaxID=2709688 RepID=UPI0035931F81